MRYEVRKSIVEVVGTIWMPMATCSYTYTLRPYDVDNARGDDGKITRESVQRWLDRHAGDFRHIDDFHASIEDGDETIDIPWASEDAELAFLDCMEQ